MVVVFPGQESLQGQAGVQQYLNARTGKYGSNCPALHHHGGIVSANKRDGEGWKST